MITISGGDRQPPFDFHRFRRLDRCRAWGRLVTLLRASGLTGWSCNLALEGIGVIDVAFLEIRLAVEVDGVARHSDVRRFQADRTKQNKLASAGWTVLRFTWRDLVDRPDDVVATIRTTNRRLVRGQAS